MDWLHGSGSVQLVSLDFEAEMTRVVYGEGKDDPSDSDVRVKVGLGTYNTGKVC